MQSEKRSRRFNARAMQVAGAPALALVWVLAAAVPALAQGSNEHTRPRTISVSGTGTVTRSPDTALVRFGVETRSGDVGKAIEAAASRSQAITRVIEGDGVASEDIATVDYTIGFVPAPATRAGGASSAPGGAGNGGTGPAAGYFRVSDVAVVTVRDLSHLGKILDDALAAGANEVQGVSFRIADRAPLEMKARAMAFGDARAKAEQIARLAGEKLGPVLQVNAGGAPVAQGGGVFRAAALAAPAVSPGSLEVSVTLEVVYSIGG